MTPKICRFDELAEVRLGVKTFLNPFFYVDAETISRFGIEDQFLEPVFRTSDVQRNHFRQRTKSTKLKIFLCSQTLDQLVGTGAAEYINWASTQRHKGKSGQVGGFWRDTPAVKPGERVWYQNQAMPPPARVVLLKAFDDTFAPLILDKTIRVDQRFNQVNPRPGVDEEILIGLLCSSWFVATVETFGRTALGQGALEMPTEALRGLPVPDIRRLPKATSARWRAATVALLAGTRQPVGQMIKNQDQRSLDEAVLKFLGYKPSQLNELYDDTMRMTRVRKLLAAGRGQIRREEFEANLDEVAESVGAQLKPLIQGRRFPADFIASGVSTNRIDFGTAALDITSESMIGQRTVQIASDGEMVFSSALPQPVAELILRALQMRQRKIDVPETDEDAEGALVSLQTLVEQLDQQLSEFAARADTGSQAALRARIEAELNFPVSQLAEPLPAVFEAHIDSLA